MAETSTQAAAAPACQGFGVTARTDAWWVGPLLTVLGLGGFGVYATWRAFFDWQTGLTPTPLGWQTSYHYGPYLSPFFSPEIFGYSPHAWFGGFPSWWPSFLPATPALMILWAPGGFRATCYYYRKAYYRSFFADPPGCAVGEPWNQYKGETAFPWVLQNMHRFFLYLAIVFIVLLAYDGVCSYVWTDPLTGRKSFGMGLGSLILTLNPICLACYTFGCHSYRHLVGGKIDCFSCTAGGEARYKAWSLVSLLNRNHMQWAWISLFTVGFSDLYVRMVATGVWRDPRFF